MKAIVAVTNDFGIGKDGDLLFNIPEDKRFFQGADHGRYGYNGQENLSVIARRGAEKP